MAFKLKPKKPKAEQKPKPLSDLEKIAIKEIEKSAQKFVESGNRPPTTNVNKRFLVNTILSTQWLDNFQN